jgi:IS1 family transposase
MNRLTPEKRAQILHLLCEGSSIRAITRITGVSKNTVAKLLNEVGLTCAEHHDKTVRGLKCKRVQVDEIWSFTYAKQRNVEDAKAAPPLSGDTWTWVGMDADTKLAVSWLVGGRNAVCAFRFMCDVASRIDTRIQLTSDGLRAYVEAVDAAFDGQVDYAQLVKLYGDAPESAKGRYSPAECTGAIKTPVFGAPDQAHISTSFVERQNLTMRMHMRRFTRLTNAFSKKFEAHVSSVALHFVYYNFCRIHKTLRVTPAMAAGVTDRLWEVSDIVGLVEAKEASEAPRARGPYRKRAGQRLENQ